DDRGAMPEERDVACGDRKSIFARGADGDEIRAGREENGATTGVLSGVNRSLYRSGVVRHAVPDGAERLHIVDLAGRPPEDFVHERRGGRIAFGDVRHAHTGSSRFGRKAAGAVVVKTKGFGVVKTLLKSTPPEESGRPGASTKRETLPSGAGS